MSDRPLTCDTGAPIVESVPAAEEDAPLFGRLLPPKGRPFPRWWLLQRRIGRHFDELIQKHTQESSP